MTERTWEINHLDLALEAHREVLVRTARETRSTEEMGASTTYTSWKEEEAWPRCLEQTAGCRPHYALSAEAPKARANQGLPAFGGRICPESRTVET
ncbi:hypothetical protein AG1IA_05776 [Rhizoctonia solani AG-1 IA]|uniref:Uncharacterized protein n=1 Tax=Thanatephorus cucumeris (strain AG1-IA) TaxID=983506 RepID=L8WV34_THACA|nr:hypothetical protein AG1IA_05776 [Rhizoctonia solani AG-1 IA]